VALTSLLPAAQLDAYGWRIAFLLGAVTVPFGLWLRSSLPETLHAPEVTIVAAKPVAGSRLLEARRHWRIFAIGLMYLGSATISTYIFTYIVTYAQATINLSARVGFIAETVGNVLTIPTILYAGAMSDRHGRRPVTIWGNLLFLVLIYPTFAWIAASRSETAFILGFILLNVVSQISTGAFYASLVESLPKSIRGTGFGLTYSFAIAASAVPRSWW